MLSWRCRTPGITTWGIRGPYYLSLATARGLSRTTGHWAMLTCHSWHEANRTPGSKEPGEKETSEARYSPA